MTLRFEHIQEDFKEFLKAIDGSSKIEIPLINKTEGRGADYENAFNKDSVRVLCTVLSDEMKRLGYSFKL